MVSFKFFVALNLLFTLASFGIESEEDDRDVIMISAPVFPANFSGLEGTQLNKVILKSVTKLNIYQMTFGDIKTDKKMTKTVHNLQVLIKEATPGKYTILAQLLDYRLKILVNQIEIGNIDRHTLLRVFEKILNNLFLPVIKDQDLPKSKKIEKKTAIIKQVNPPSEMQVASDDFRQRVMSMQNGVDKIVSEVRQEHENKKLGDKNSDKKNPTNESGLDLRESLSLVGDIPPQDKALKEKSALVSEYTVKLTYYKFSTDYTGTPSSSGLGANPQIGIGTDAAYGGIGFTYKVLLSKQHTLSSDFEYARTVQKMNTPVAEYFKAGLQYNFILKQINLSPLLRFETENLSYGVLSSPGSGVEAVNNRYFSYAAGLNLMNFFSQYSIFFTYSKPFYVNSNKDLFKGGTLSGNKMNIGLYVKEVFRKSNLELIYSRITYSYQNSTAPQNSQTQILGVNLSYIF